MLKKLALLFVGLLVGLFILFVVAFAYGLSKSTSEPPAPPPNWNSSNSSYKIVKEGKHYLVAYTIDGNSGKYYVGNSKVNLENYVNKNVKINGSFPQTWTDNTTNTQCVAGNCHKIFEPKFWQGQNPETSVIHIDTVKVAE